MIPASPVRSSLDRTKLLDATAGPTVAPVTYRTTEAPPGVASAPHSPMRATTAHRGSPTIVGFTGFLPGIQGAIGASYPALSAMSDRYMSNYVAASPERAAALRAHRDRRDIDRWGNLKPAEDALTAAAASYTAFCPLKKAQQQQRVANGGTFSASSSSSASIAASASPTRPATGQRTVLTPLGGGAAAPVAVSSVSASIATAASAAPSRPGTSLEGTGTYGLNLGAVPPVVKHVAGYSGYRRGAAEMALDSFGRSEIRLARGEMTFH